MFPSLILLTTVRSSCNSPYIKKLRMSHFIILVMETIKSRLERLKKNIIRWQEIVRRIPFSKNISEIILVLEDLKGDKRKLQSLQDDFDVIASPDDLKFYDPTFETLFSAINTVIIRVTECKRELDRDISRKAITNIPPFKVEKGFVVFDFAATLPI